MQKVTHCRKIETCQPFISMCFDNYGWQQKKTSNSVSHESRILYKSSYRNGIFKTQQQEGKSQMLNAEEAGWLHSPACKYTNKKLSGRKKCGMIMCTRERIVKQSATERFTSDKQQLES